MRAEDRDIITAEMGVEPVMFNASLVSAQSRKRLFWTNIPFTLPPDRGILLKDILQPDAEVDESMFVNPETFHRIPHSGRNPTKKLGHLSNTDSQGNRVYSPEGKSVTLGALGGGGGAKTGLYEVQDRIGRDVGRRLNAEGHREDYNKDIPIQRQLELRTDDKSGTLTSVLKDNLVVGETRIRKLTPIECERLQGLPDNYTEGIAKTHRYKCLGNGFCVPVIAHILGNLRP